jgi:Cys-tRNA(Pro)/Cys-tRNA(Cys) deacylase
MKKKFPTYFDSSAADHERITVSAGVRGAQLLIDTQILIKFVNAILADVT